MTAVLDLHVQAKRFGQRLVLSDVRLRLAAGEVVSLVGASGCGKSTLLRIAAGLDDDFTGRVTLTAGAGVVFQEPRLFPWLTVAQNVAFAAGAPPADERALALLAEVGLSGHERALPKQLSGGQAQRVAIARALFTQPRLLLLDEPFSAVDAFTRMKLQDLLAELARRHGVTLLLVTHDLDEAVLLGDRVVVLGSEARGVVDDIAVDLPRPRARSDAALATARGRVLDALHEAHAL
ncbi:ABC transporter ATP-binding protein [Roseateles asaccharophilus]|uniref:Sulfonate transport system ATP-binding protein n=1 Tax=Roseateles asaccharophilus TaxID=582607 RepID=A0ABU2A927_9BURK|nr:ABC transporter ATP-binding protein [Roseateles asaccharophilus]MDR7333711.1 sulfonate transport system ATP-binding protein [Roseateles asaccharophilus]